MLLDHKPTSVLCDTRDGLRIVAAEDGLFFWLRPRTIDGRLATLEAQHAARSGGRGEVSIGFTPLAYTEAGSDPVRVTVTRARLGEISLTRNGACPGVWFEVRGG